MDMDTLKAQAIAGFRPLAGINCNLLKVNKFHDYYTFPSPCGDKLQLDTRNEDDCIIRSFRPLAGINCNARDSRRRPLRCRFPSPCGDKLQFHRRIYDLCAVWFPSPCGDKLQSEFAEKRYIDGKVSVPLRG